VTALCGVDIGYRVPGLADPGTPDPVPGDPALGLDRRHDVRNRQLALCALEQTRKHTLALKVVE
jgi:hypothetical protein